MARALDIELPPREKISIPAIPKRETILIHSGAGQAIRVWPLENYRQIVRRLRGQNRRVQVACDPDQENWWRKTARRRWPARATSRN